MIDTSVAAPSIAVRVVAHPLEITIQATDQTDPWMRWTAETLGLARVRSVSVRHLIAWDFFRDHGVDRRALSHLLTDHTDGPTRTLVLGFKPDQAAAKLTFEGIGSSHLTWRIESLVPEFNRIHWGFRDPSAAPLYGFGQRTHPIARRAKFDAWVEEGAVGLGRLSRWLRWTGRVPIPKGGYTSPAPLAWWLSRAGYISWLETSAMIRFDRQPKRFRASIWDRQVSGHLVGYQTPLAGLEQSSASIGRPQPLPRWAFAPWNDSVRGEAAASELLQFLRAQRIPSSVLWIEDWTGSWENRRRFWMRPLSHQLDRALYPNLEFLASQARQQGVRLLGYFCPEVTVGTPLYREALALDCLVRDEAGQPVVISILGIRHGELDLTSERSRQFVRERMLKPAVALGFDGWMADFGEYLPVSSQMQDGSNGWVTHNRYPLLWQELHQRFWQAERPNGDFVYFSRSATLGSQSTVSVLWGGDSDTDWDPADGLASVVSQLISASLCGFAHWGTDIAGYMTLGLTQPSTKELYLRWLQLGALCPIMRTHHGTARPRNWNFRSDEETTRIYTRYARLHTALAPYWHRLSSHAVSRGWPIIRALFIEYPNEPEAWHLSDQFLVGSDLLVAPILTPGTRRRRVWLPPGSWHDWWTGQVHQGPGWIEARAAVDHIPLWVRAGSVIALFEGARIENSGDDRLMLDGIVDTLADGDGLTDWQTANQCLSLLLAGDTRQSCTLDLADGSRLTLTPVDPAADERAIVLRAPAPQAADHLPGGGLAGQAVFLQPGMAATIDTGPKRSWRIAVQSGPARWYVLRRFDAPTV